LQLIFELLLNAPTIGALTFQVPVKTVTSRIEQAACRVAYQPKRAVFGVNSSTAQLSHPRVRSKAAAAAVKVERARP